MATDYRQILWEGTTGVASSVKWVNGNTTVYPAVVKWNTDTVFARAMDVTMVTKTGISNIQYTFTAGDVSTNISRGNYGFFWGDTFTVTPTAASWWTVTPASKTVVLNSTYFDLATSATPSMLYMRDFFTPSRLARTLSVTGDAHVQVTGGYINTSGNSATLTTKSTTTKTVTDAWQGATVTFTAATDTYWKINTSSGLGSKEPGTTALAASVTSTRKLRTINVTKNANITAITVSYGNSSGSTASQSFTASGSITQTWSGADVTYTASAAQYWSTSGGTISKADNENAVSVSPIATRLARTIKLLGDSHVTVNLSYTNTNGSAASGSATTATVTKSDVFQGATATSSAAYATYWKKNSESNIGSIQPGTTEVLAQATSTRKLRTINVTLNQSVTAITVTYGNSSGTAASKSFTSNGSVTSTFSGSKVTYSAAAATYWSTSGGTINEADNENAVTVAPTASRVARTIKLTTDAHSKLTVVYTNTSGTANQSYTANNSSTNVGPTNLWQGATCTITPSANTYYKITGSSGNTGTIGAGTSALSASATSGIKTRAITFTKNEGIASAKITWYSTDTSSISTATPTSSGTVTNSSFSGKQVGITPTAVQYWQAQDPYVILAMDNENTVIVDPTATRLARTIKILGDSHVTVSLSYTNTNGAAASGSATTATVTKSDVFQGAAATSSTSYATYWKKNTESNIGNIAAGSSTVTATATSTRKLRTIAVTKNANITGIVITYTNSAGTVTSQSLDASGYITQTFSGAKITYSATAAQYWSTSGGTLNEADNETQVAISPTASRLARTIKLLGDAHATVSLSYTNTNGSAASGSATTATVTKSDVFQGAAATSSVAYSTYWKKNTESNIGTIGAGTTEVFAQATSTRKLRNITVTKNANITAITVTYTNSSGTAASQSFTASGAINSTFSGGKVTYSAAAAQYYTTNGGTINEADNETGVSVSPTANEKKRAIDATVNAHIDSITIQFQPNSGTTMTATPSTSGAVTNSSFSGAKVTWSAAASTYYKLATSSGEIAAADNTTKVTVAPAAATEKKRAVDVTFNSNVAAITVKYQPSSGTTVTVTPTASGAVTNSSFSGAKVTWSASAAQYYTMTTSGEIAAANNETKVTVSPTASKAARRLEANADSHVRVTVNYQNTNGTSGSITTKSTTTTYTTTAWQGYAATSTAEYDTYWKKLAESNIGTIAAGTNTVTAMATSQRKLRTINVDYDTTTMSSVNIQYINSLGSTTSSGTAASVSIANTYSGGTVTYSITGKQYCADLVGTIDPANNENDVTTPRNKGLARTIKLTSDAHSRLTVHYTNTNFASNQYYTTTRSASNVGPTDLWQGATCTIQGERDSYYNISTTGTGTINPGSSALSATSTSSLRMRTIHFNVAATQISYINASGASITNGSVAAGSDLSIWCGGNASWRGTTPAYAYMAPVTGSLAAADTSATYTYSPTISGLTRDVTASITYNSYVQTGVRLGLKANCASYYGTGGLSDVTKAVVSGIIGIATWSNAAQGNATTITVTDIDNSYYTYSPAYVTVPAATATGSASFSITRRPRTVTVNVASGTKANVQFNSTSGYVSVDISANTTYATAWCGSSVTANYTTTDSAKMLVNGAVTDKPFSTIANAYHYTDYVASATTTLPTGTSGGTINCAYTVLNNPYTISISTHPGRPTVYFGVVNDSLYRESIPVSVNNTSGMSITTVSASVKASTSDGVAWYAPVASYWTATGAGISARTYSYAAPASVNGTRSIQPTATKRTRTAGITRGTYWTRAITAATMYYVSGTGTAITRTYVGIPTNATGNYNTTAWQGGEVTFSISAKAGWTYTAPAAIPAGSGTVYRTVDPYANPAQLDEFCEGTWASQSEIQIKIYNYTGETISNIEINRDRTYAYDSNDSEVDLWNYSSAATVTNGMSTTIYADFHDDVSNGYGEIVVDYKCNGQWYTETLFSW